MNRIEGIEMAAKILFLLLGVILQAYGIADVRRVVLLERFGFAAGRSANVSLVEVPGVQKLIIAACRDPTLSQCQGFALDGRYIRGFLAEPASHHADDVFLAFFGKSYSSKLFMASHSFEPHFTFNHLEDGKYELEYEVRGAGSQKSLYVPKPVTRGYTYLFVGVEVKLGVSDPVGSVVV